MSTYVGKFITAVSAALEFNTATLSGAMDVIVIEDPDGKRQSTPFHVRFGKLQLLKTRGIPINVEINGQRTALRMFLGAAGEAYFYNPPRQPQPETPVELSASPSASFTNDEETTPCIESIPPSESAPQLTLTPPAKSDSTDQPEPQKQLPGTPTDGQANKDTVSKPACLSPSLLANQSQQPEHEYHIAYVSDSEVELTRTARAGAAEFIEEPRSPPLLSSRRNWDASPSFFSPTASATMSISTSANTDVTPSAVTFEESDNSALFGLPSTPRRPRTVSTPILEADVVQASVVDVTVSSAFTDVVVEEERKLDVRSVDGYDTDDEDDEITETTSKATSNQIGTDDIVTATTVTTNDDGQTTESSSKTTNRIGTDIVATETTNDDDQAAVRLQRHLSRMLSSSQTVELDNLGEDSYDTTESHNVEPVDEVLSMSLCGDLISENMQEEHIIELFDRHRLTYDDIISNPNIFSDPKLMFRLHNRIIDSRVAVPFLLTALAFGKCLDFEFLSRETAQLSANGKEYEKEVASSVEPSKSPETPSRRFRWFTWGSQTVVGEPLLEEEHISALEDKKEEIGRELTAAENHDKPVDDNTDRKDAANNDSTSNDQNPSEAVNGNGNEKQPVSASETKNGAENADTDSGNEKKEDDELNPTGNIQNKIEEKKEDENPDENPDENKDRPEFSDLDPAFLFLQPTDEQLRSLPLQEGANSMRFYVDESTAELSCRVFLWSQHSKIVISDVDGTITRSDVLGHLLPAVGRDWSQVGVAGLYTQIEKNGYKLVYLTARPIGQASQTRAFLHNVTQGSAKLPNGPVLMSPNRLVESFTREVIRRKPHEFKIAALREVRNLFPPDYNPFHAGFGNRDTDVISYRAVGLIPQRIFVVNPRGELVVMKETYESAASYSNLTDLVEKVFPDISGHGESEKIQTLTINTTYNDWHFWRSALPSLNVEELLKK